MRCEQHGDICEKIDALNEALGSRNYPDYIGFDEELNLLLMERGVYDAVFHSQGVSAEDREKLYDVMVEYAKAHNVEVPEA